MTRYILVLALITSQFLAAQNTLPATTRVGLQELQGLAEKYPKAQELTNETQGYYPTAMIHGRCMVGFLGKVNGSFDASAVEHGVVMQGTQKRIRYFLPHRCVSLGCHPPDQWSSL